MKLYKLLLIIFSFIICEHLQGQRLSIWKLADLQKTIDTVKRPIILNFWATFCQPCLAEIPHFQQLAKKYKEQGVKLVLISCLRK